jgi:hypothetical protein
MTAYTWLKVNLVMAIHHAIKQEIFNGHSFENHCSMYEELCRVRAPQPLIHRFWVQI